MDDETRFVKYRKSDIAVVRKLQESFMREAAFGLLFRTGQAVGSRLARNARPYKQQYFEAVRRILVDEGWVSNIQFQNDTITATGSIEIEKGTKNTCHMLRGIIAKVYEGYFGKLMTCTEAECEGTGKQHCVFKVSFTGNGTGNGPQVESKGNGQRTAGGRDH
jgi:predicted hydrocarbon binding protein